MPPFFSLIRDVNPSTSLWAMRLRVVRAYEVPVFNNESQISSYEIIFHDKEKDRIHATVKASAMKNLKNKPLEGHIYAIKDFLVVENRMKFKTTSNPMKIIFLQKTKVEEIFDDKFPESTFLFKPFKEFECMKESPQFELFDVIGKLKSCQIGPTQIVKGKRMEFQLEDIDQNTLSCTLWDNYADALMPYLDHKSGQNVVVIIQLGRMSVFADEIKFSNTYNVTKVVINGDGEEFAAYNKKLKEAGIDGSGIMTLENSTVLALVDDFNSGQAAVKNVAELTSYNVAGCFWVHATIVEVELLSKWCYLACKVCSKKLTPINGVYFCSKCVKTDRNGYYRYKIEVSVRDESGATRFMLWDKECFQLVGKTAGDIMKANKEAFDFVPKEIEEALTDRVGIFKVQVKDGDYMREFVTYSVTKMTADAKVLSIYNEKYASGKEVNMLTESDVESGEGCSVVVYNDKSVDDDGDEVLLKNLAVNDNTELAATKKRKRVMKKEN